MQDVFARTISGERNSTHKKKCYFFKFFQAVSLFVRCKKVVLLIEHILKFSVSFNNIMISVNLVIREKTLLKKDIQILRKQNLSHVMKRGNQVKCFKPWLGDAFSFLYDSIMSRSIFPKKFGADMEKHYELLSQELEGVHDKSVLELATGSGSAVHFLANDNRYTGSDISPGLLKRAVKKFNTAGFKEAEFYVTSADDLPFSDEQFDVCLCIASFNFFDHHEQVVKEINRVLHPGGTFLCSVPVPERNIKNSTIRG